jgi:hypothetical protein
METLDVLVKKIPVPIHNMFKGFCSMKGISVNEGIIDVMITFIENETGGSNESLKTIVEQYNAERGKK